MTGALLMEGPTGSLQGSLTRLSVGSGTARFLLILKIYLNRQFLKEELIQTSLPEGGVTELPVEELGLRNSGPIGKR